MVAQNISVGTCNVNLAKAADERGKVGMGTKSNSISSQKYGADANRTG